MVAVALVAQASYMIVPRHIDGPQGLGTCSPQGSSAQLRYFFAERVYEWSKYNKRLQAPLAVKLGYRFLSHPQHLSTWRKRGHTMLAALAAVFAGKPLHIAWESE
jgi:hypothetical protein